MESIGRFLWAARVISLKGGLGGVRALVAAYTLRGLMPSVRDRYRPRRGTATNEPQFPSLDFSALQSVTCSKTVSSVFQIGSL